MRSLSLDVCRAGVPAVAALALLGPLNAANAQAIGPDFADMVQQVLPSVVTVSIEGHQPGMSQQMPGRGPNPFGPNPFNPFGPFGPFGPGGPGGPGFGPGQDDPGQQIQGLGSGFIIDPRGYLVTNNHVIENADSITVTLHDGQSYDATLIGTDPSTDIAVVKIDSDETFPAVAWGESDSLRIGNWVVAIGGPFGLSGTVTAGIVSATGRDLHAGPYDNYIQFDASINPGNSGGPVFNTDGEVVAISTAIASPSRGSVGIGFAVPESIARPVVEQLMSTGMVERGFIGVQIQAVTDELAQAMELDSPTGALVAEVRPDSPAAAAGIQAGDLIIGFNGEKVDKMHDLPRMVSAITPGTTVPLEVLRNGETVALSITVGRLGGDQVATAETPAVGEPVGRLGLTVASAADYGWRGAHGETDGVVITVVEAGSPAERGGLLVGDVILAVGGHAVGDAAAFSEALAAHERDGDAMVALLVERDGDRRFIPLPLATS
ncbi:MAG: Do family serine endopeptidase [Alphaproteobacteria bacterium]